MVQNSNIINYCLDVSYKARRTNALVQYRRRTFALSIHRVIKTINHNRLDNKPIADNLCSSSKFIRRRYENAEGLNKNLRQWYWPLSTHADLRVTPRAWTARSLKYK